MNAEPSTIQVPPPKDWHDFERHMRDLFEAHWRSRATMHARTGQPQHGVDIYGQPNGGDAYHGVQCKLHDANANAEATGTELKAEVDKATKFKPRLAHFILVTTGPRDAKIQAEVRRLNERKTKAFTVEVMFWDDILTLYGQHRDVFFRHYHFLFPGPDRLHQLRPPLKDFTGRQEEIDDLLAHIDQGVGISAVQGLGGVGKTELAYVLADRLKDAYPDAQLYLDLKGTSQEPLKPADVLAFVIRCFHPESKLPDDVTELRGQYHSTLTGKRVLLLLDNAGGPDHHAAAEQIRPLCPPPSGTVLVVTSRQHFTLPDLYSKNLQALPEPDATNLLLTICPRIAEAGVASAPRGRRGTPKTPPFAAQIAQLCAYLPLALRAAASLLAVRPDIAVDAYVRDLADERTRLEQIGDEGVEIGVEASLNLSYRQLSAEAARVFRLLSIFPATFHAPAEEHICEDQGHVSLGELLRHSLVEFDEATQRYRLHDLVRILAARRLDGPARLPAEQRHAEHYRTVLAAADDRYLKGGSAILEGLALVDTEWSNIQAGAAWARGHAESSRAALALALVSEYPHAGAYVLSLRLHPRERAAWLEAAVAAARKLADRAAQAEHLGNLGSTYADLGEPRRAIEYHEQCLEITRALGDRRAEGQTLSNLGLAYADLGEPRRAIEFYEQALEIVRAIGDRRGESNALGNLGLAYAALGEPRRAMEFYEQALVISREIGDRRAEGQDLGNLGNAYAALGEPRRAIEFYEQRLEIARAIGDRRGEANALGNLGLAYTDLGEPRRAIEFYEQALEIARVLGDRRGEGSALGNLGSAYHVLGEPRPAIEFYKQHLEIARGIGDRLGEGSALGNLGLACAALGEPRPAIEFYEQQLAITRAIGDRRGEANASWNMGLACERLGDLPRAAELMQVLVDYERELGHPDAENHASEVAALRARLK